MWLRFNENLLHHLHFLSQGLYNCIHTELDFQRSYFSEFNFEIPRDSLRQHASITSHAHVGRGQIKTHRSRSNLLDKAAEIEPHNQMICEQFKAKMSDIKHMISIIE